MHNYTIELSADNQPTVLERILQVIRYRGFVLIDITSFLNEEQDSLDIKLVINDPKENKTSVGEGIHRLYDQLNKLFDVHKIKLIQTVDMQYRA